MHAAAFLFVQCCPLGCTGVTFETIQGTVGCVGVSHMCTTRQLQAAMLVQWAAKVVLLYSLHIVLLANKCQGGLLCSL
jgi:hypothetical protein